MKRKNSRNRTRRKSNHKRNTQDTRRRNIRRKNTRRRNKRSYRMLYRRKSRPNRKRTLRGGTNKLPPPQPSFDMFGDIMPDEPDPEPAVQPKPEPAPEPKPEPAPAPAPATPPALTPEEVASHLLNAKRLLQEGGESHHLAFYEFIKNNNILGILTKSQIIEFFDFLNKALQKSSHKSKIALKRLFIVYNPQSRVTKDVLTSEFNHEFSVNLMHDKRPLHLSDDYKLYKVILHADLSDDKLEDLKLLYKEAGDIQPRYATTASDSPFVMLTQTINGKEFIRARGSLAQSDEGTTMPIGMGYGTKLIYALVITQLVKVHDFWPNYGSEQAHQYIFHNSVTIWAKELMGSSPNFTMFEPSYDLMNSIYGDPYKLFLRYLLTTGVLVFTTLESGESIDLSKLHLFIMNLSIHELAQFMKLDDTSIEELKKEYVKFKIPSESEKRIIKPKDEISLD